MLSVLISPSLKIHKKTFKGDEYAYYLDCGDGIPGVYSCTN